MIVLTAVLGLLAAILLLPTVSDLLSLFRLARGKRSSAQPPAEPPRLLFLVPAHNEERMIESCVRSLLNQQYPERFTAVVIADNCEDQTAGGGTAGTANQWTHNSGTSNNSAPASICPAHGDGD